MAAIRACLCNRSSCVPARLRGLTGRPRGDGLRPRLAFNVRHHGTHGQILMSPRVHFYVVALVLTAAFTPFGVSILGEKQLDSADKLANYREGLARITEAKEVRSKRSGTTVYVTYEFRADAGTTYAGQGSISLDEWKENRGEKPLRVYFDPSSPAKNTLARGVDVYAEERPLEVRLPVAVLISSPLAIILAAIWAWVVSRRSRQSPRSLQSDV